jgi:hypothetical protein
MHLLYKRINSRADCASSARTPLVATPGLRLLIATAVFIPLGPATSKGVEWLTKEGFLNKERVFHGLPHPGREHSEHTAYFLGEKERADLTKDTNADKVDAARDYLRKAVAALK